MPLPFFEVVHYVGRVGPGSHATQVAQVSCVSPRGGLRDGNPKSRDGKDPPKKERGPLSCGRILPASPPSHERWWCLFFYFHAPVPTAPHLHPPFVLAFLSLSLSLSLSPLRISVTIRIRARETRAENIAIGKSEERRRGISREDFLRSRNRSRPAETEYRLNIG